MLTSVRRRLCKGVIVASLLALALVAMTGFGTTVGAAALKQSYAPAGATGTGVNAPPVGSEPLQPGAWDARNYRIPNPVTICPQPPQNASARYALANSPTLLDYYGLPRPSIYQGDIVRWQQLVATMTRRSCDSSTPILNGHPIVNYGFTRSTIWGGWGNDHCTSCRGYQAAQFSFAVPAIPTTTGYTSDSIWVGVGGANSGTEALSQVGVSEHSFLGFVSYYPFYESNNCGQLNQEYDLTSMSISVYDSMFFYTDATGYDVFDDISTGNYQTKNWGCGDADSIEFIIERNGNNNTAPLADYSQVYALNATYEDATGDWWGVDQSAGGSGDGLWSWGLTSNVNCGCYLETQSTPVTAYGTSMWYWTWQRSS